MVSMAIAMSVSMAMWLFGDGCNMIYRYDRGVERGVWNRCVGVLDTHVQYDVAGDRFFQAHHF